MAVLELLTTAFRQLEGLVPMPQAMPLGDGTAPRYSARLPQQALIVKLARVISGLRAIDILIREGCLQEQGAIQRVVDDASEDILFIAYGLQLDEWTPDHEQFMREFWIEAVDSEGDLRIYREAMVARRKIRAFVAHAQDRANPSRASEIGRLIFQTYSGFVHSFARTTMDLVEGNPPRFAVEGQMGSLRQAEYAADAANYFYRSLISAFAVAMTLGAAGLAEQLRLFIDELGSPT